MSSELTKANGVGPSTVASLEEHGFQSIEDLASASLEEVMLVPGFGESRATQAIASAKVIAAESSTAGSKPEIKSSGDKNEKAKVTVNAVKKKLADAGKKAEATAKSVKKKLAKVGKKAKALAKAEKKKLAKAAKKAKAKVKAEKKKLAKAAKKAKAKAKKHNKKK